MSWKGFHMRMHEHENAVAFLEVIEPLAKLGVNVIILEINEGYRFRSHPELSAGTVTKEDARKLSVKCKENNIRLIPLFNCLGHQGWKGKPSKLLEVYPEFDETPHIPEDDEDIYCRSWCPLHPKINDIIFDLIDELIDAFEADAFHVGVDEVFILADENCPRCSGKDKAQLFAKAVNDYYNHIVKEKNIEMLIWGDRLIKQEGTDYGYWDADNFGIWPAIDLIPKDIIICDWHYDEVESFASIPLFLDKGFRMIPSVWKKPQVALDFMRVAEKEKLKRNDTENMLGILVTGWNTNGKKVKAVLVDKIKDEKYKETEQIINTLNSVMEEMKDER